MAPVMNTVLENLFFPCPPFRMCFSRNNLKKFKKKSDNVVLFLQDNAPARKYLLVLQFGI